MADRTILLAVALIVFVTQGAGYAQDTVRSASESLTATKTAAQAQGPPLPQPESITCSFLEEVRGADYGSPSIHADRVS